MKTDAQLGEAGERIRMRSHERRIEGQHARLDDFAHDVHEALDKEGATGAIDDFELYVAAFEAHMRLEEEVTFPRLHGLRPDLEARLTALMREHDVLRSELVAIDTQLQEGDESGARLRFEALARRIEGHEAQEEELLALVGEGPMVAVMPTA